MSATISRIARFFSSPAVFLCVALTILSPDALAQTIIAYVQPGLAPHPEYANLYWDQNWDRDNSQMTMNQIDNFTSALLNSTYFAGLKEYGVNSATFHSRSYIANPACGGNGTAPNVISFVNPLYVPPTPITPAIGDPGIMEFITCEIVNNYIPNDLNLVYNIFLPPTTVENDGSADLTGIPGITLFSSCVRYSGYHFNVTPAGPLFTVIFADPACSAGFAGLTENLSHEMVEAASDPFPVLSVIFAGGNGEIGDICAPGSGAAGAGAAATPFLAPFGGGTTEKYWSNAAQTCTTGFSSATTPSFASTTPGGSASTLALTVDGLGFGTLPPITSFAGNIGTPVVLSGGPVLIPYLAVEDRGPTDTTLILEAGNLMTPDGVPAAPKWSDTRLDVLVAKGPTFAPRIGDFLDVVLCNPASGQCGTSKAAQVPSGTISGLFPNTGPAGGGTAVKITGSGFTGDQTDTTVIFGDRPSVIPTFVSSVEVRAISPMSRPGSVTVQVLTKGMPSTGANYTYCRPQVNNVTPNSSPQYKATAVNIDGNCFTGATSVSFGVLGTAFVGTPQVTSVFDTRIQATAPAVPQNMQASLCHVTVNVMSPDLDGSIGGLALPGNTFFYGDATHQMACQGPGSVSNGSFQNLCMVDPAACASILGLNQLVTAGNPLQPVEFNDFAGYEWAVQAVKKVVSQGVLQGVSADHFAPAQLVTRSDFANGMARTLNIRSRRSIVFSDVGTQHPMHAIYAAVQPYMIAYQDRTGSISFNAALPVDRQEAALTAVSLLVTSKRVKLVGGAQAEEILERLDDQKLIPLALRPYVATAIKNGILTVDMRDKKSFRPNSFLGRAEFAAMLVRLEEFFSHR
jgi:hypothetical protein